MADPEFNSVFFFLSPSEFHNMQSFLFFAFVLFCVCFLSILYTQITDFPSI